jgi:hypothetical protein
VGSPNTIDHLMVSLGLMDPPALKTHPFNWLAYAPLMIETYLIFFEMLDKFQLEACDNIIVTMVMWKKERFRDSLVFHKFVEVKVFLNKEASEENPRAGVSIIFDRSADLNGIYTSLPIEETLSDSIHNSKFPCTCPILHSPASIDMCALDHVHLREASSYPEGDILQALVLTEDPLPFRMFLGIILNTSKMSGVFNPFTHNCYAYADAIMRTVQEYTAVTPITFGNSFNIQSIIGGGGRCFGILMMEPLSIDIICQSIICHRVALLCNIAS